MRRLRKDCGGFERIAERAVVGSRYSSLEVQSSREEQGSNENNGEVNERQCSRVQQEQWLAKALSFVTDA